MRSPLGVALGLAVIAGFLGCGSRGGLHQRLTGTCSGACAHYIECKPGHPEADRATCEQECPGVFSDQDSLMAFESLQCRDAVEFVDGTRPRQAITQSSFDRAPPSR